LWIFRPNGRPFLDVQVIRGTGVTGISTTCLNRLGSNRPAEWVVTDRKGSNRPAEWAVTDPQNG